MMSAKHSAQKAYCSTCSAWSACRGSDPRDLSRRVLEQPPAGLYWTTVYLYGAPLSALIVFAVIADAWMLNTWQSLLGILVTTGFVGWIVSCLRSRLEGMLKFEKHVPVLDGRSAGSIPPEHSAEKGV